MRESKQYRVERDGERDLTFKGVQIGNVTSYSCQGSSNNRWTELKLYVTDGDNYVAEEIGRTCWQGESDRHSGKVCATDEEVIEFFGLGWLAKKLYDNAGLRYDEVVE